MKRYIHSATSTQQKISKLEERIADLKQYIEECKADGCDLEDIIDEQQELMELEDELNFAWQDDEAEYNYALEQQEFNPDGSLKFYGSTKIEADTEITSAQIEKILADHGIDTTMNQYELCAQAYERYGRGQVYRKKFKCPGNYLAYFSMEFHAAPTSGRINEYFNNIEDLEYFIEQHPTVKDIAEFAESEWWGDGDDYIYYLKNLTTGEYLYGSLEEGEDEGDWE